MSEYQMMPQRETDSTEQIFCLSEAEFHERLVQFFRPFVSTRPMDWACIRAAMGFFAPIFKFKILADLYFDYIFGLFEDFRITDRVVIASSLKYYCRFKLKVYGFPRTNPNEIQYPMDLRQENMLSHYDRSVLPMCVEEMLSRPILYRDLKAVERFLRYISPTYIWFTDCKDYCRHVVRSIKQDTFFQNQVHRIDYHVNLYNGRRFKLIFMAMDFVLLMRKENYQDAIKGFRLLFQSIPDPYITLREILGFLTSCLKFSPSDERQLSYFIMSFQESCMRGFPECQRVLKPRSLKHLARCKVRSCLTYTHTLPHGVWSIGLPRELEDYVLLQTRKDQFWPVIRPLSS